MSDRQQIYDRIRELGGKNKLILEEMTRKGFWKPGTAQTEVSEEFIKREADLVSELRSLYAKQQKYEDRDKALAAMRSERLKKSREQRKEKKLEREQIAESKTEAWEKRKAEEILYLGDESSGALNDLASQGEFDSPNGTFQTLPPTALWPRRWKSAWENCASYPTDAKSPR